MIRRPRSSLHAARRGTRPPPLGTRVSAEAFTRPRHAIRAAA